jgi:hypothetical protein
VTDTVWLDEDLTLGGYQYFIQARFDECENVTNSDTVMVDVITGLEDYNLPEISVFPNPVFEQVTVKSNRELGEIILYEASGRIAATWLPVETHTMTLPMQGFTPGIYMLMIRTGAEIKVVKLCLIK